MFIEFSVENFRSIKDRVTLSLVAANLRSRDAKLDSETEINVSSKLSLLRSVVVYGANGSGKSNIFKAFAFMRQFVRNSAREGQTDDAIPVTPFRLNPLSTSKPSTFEAVFLIDGLQYRYGFIVNTRCVVEEWLYYTPTIREIELFTRDAGSIHVSSTFREGRGLQERTRDNALFLSVVAQFNGKLANQVTGWFTRTCQVITATEDFGYLPFTMYCIEKGKHREQIEELVRRLDLDITNLSIAEVAVPRELSRIHKALSRVERLDSDGSKEEAIKPGVDFSVGVTKELQSRHPLRDDEGKIVGSMDFPIDEMESEGTRKLIALAGPIIDTLARGDVLVVDEIDARLHPLITAAFLRLFNSTQTNPKNAQLICATHDTNLLDRRHYRRDQIYFVEKDLNAATSLFSLADFKLEAPKGARRTVRNDAMYERDYIQGRYGAVPFIGDLHHLFAEELQEVERLASQEITSVTETSAQ